MSDVVVLRRIKKRGNEFIDLGTVTIPKQYLEATLKAFPYFEVVHEETFDDKDARIKPPETPTDFCCPICGSSAKTLAGLNLHKYRKHGINFGKGLKKPESNENNVH